MAVLIGFVGFCLGPSLVGTRTLISVDTLSAYFPWMANGGNIDAGHEVCSSDTIDAVMPGIAHVRSQLFSGHLASWQNVVSGGGTLSSVPSLGLLDPLSLPYFVLPLWLAPAFVALLSFIVAVGGTFLFLRRLTVSRPAAMLAGLIFSTSGFMVMWTNWPQTRVAALIPALFWAVERLVQRTKVTDAILVAAVIASMIFGGFPAVTGYALYLATAYLLVRVVVLYRSRLRDAWRTVGLAATGVVLGAALTAVQLLPFLSFYRETNFAYRAGEASAGLPLTGLITLVAPNANGLCIIGKTTQGNVIETVAFVGAAAMVLAVAGAAFGFGSQRRLTRGFVGFFVAAATVIVVLGWLSPTARLAVAHLPAFADNFIGRIRSVLGFVLAVLAAIGFDWLTLRRKRGQATLGQRAGRGIWAALVGAGVVVLGLVVAWRFRHDALVGHYWTEQWPTLWIPGVLLVAALAVAGLSRIRHRWTQIGAFILMPLLVAGQGAQFFHTVLPGDSRQDFYPDTPAHQFLASHLGHDRFTSSGGTMLPATALYYNLRTPTGHAFIEPAWQDLLTRVDPKVMVAPTYSTFSVAMSPATVGTEPILDRMGVKYFVAASPTLNGNVLPLPVATGVLDVGAGPARCTIPSQPLRGVTFELAHTLLAVDHVKGETLHVTVETNGRTISSGRYMGSQIPASTPISVAVAGEDLARDGTASVTISETGGRGDVTLVTHDGQVACAAVTPVADHLKVVYADPGTIIYQRLDALPRIRWASRTAVIPSATARVAALAQGVPADEVVLNAPGPAAVGRNARVDIGADSGDKISADVSAGGGGYLVVADAMQQPGWSVTVDGKSARLVPADDAMVAVFVPAGQHRVHFEYRAPGQRTGAAVSAVALLVALALLIWEWRRPRGHLQQRRPPQHRRRRLLRSPLGR